MAHIKLENISKRFGSLVALKNISLEVHDQEFLVLLGPTGAGKTTTLRCAAGLERPNLGTVYIDGDNVTDVSPAERDVAFVFQNYALYPRKTVYGNIAFPLIARKFTPEEIDKSIHQVTELLHIDHLLDRLPAQLSGGEQQRVALARSLVRQPRVYLMDEPLTNLDFKLRTQMRTELKRTQRELEATFFYVTNDQIEALSMGDRIAVLNGGELQQIGPPQEVYDNPTNIFVAGFIGSTRMNFLRCSYENDSREIVGKDNNWRVNLEDGLCDGIVAHSNHDDLIFGIRPEDVAVADEGELAGPVYNIEPLGDRIVYQIQVGDDMVKIKMPPTSKMNPGDEVKLKVNVARAHVFDRLSEKAIPSNVKE
jgi:multiple sugar transport system ATP-binding protein